MAILPPPHPIYETAEADAIRFENDIRPRGSPAVLRGLASHWPAVAAAKSGDQAVAEYLLSFGPRRSVVGVMASPEIRGRFFYNQDMTGFNFSRHEGRFDAFLAELLRIKDDPSPPAMAVQSAMLSDLLPGFAEANPMPLASQIEPRIWMGNRIRVAPHYDPMENIAVCLAGRRRFTLFPPDQLPNLYPGPLDFTPAGAPISMVDPLDPDLVRFPRYREAWDNALQATLNPGDAIYIPYAWWHGVESLDPVSFLVNYWWVEKQEGIGEGFDALLHAVLAYRHLPADQRSVWKTMLDHYIFDINGNPAEDWPQHVHGIMAQADPRLFKRIRETLKKNLA
jgi:hypothetical protein